MISYSTTVRIDAFLGAVRKCVDLYVFKLRNPGNLKKTKQTIVALASLEPAKIKKSCSMSHELDVQGYV